MLQTEINVDITGQTVMVQCWHTHTHDFRALPFPISLAVDCRGLTFSVSQWSGPNQVHTDGVNYCKSYSIVIIINYNILGPIGPEN